MLGGRIVVSKSFKLLSLRKSSNDAKVAMRAARKAKVESSKSNSITPTRVGIIVSLAAATFTIYDIKTNPESSLGKLYYGSPVDQLLTWVHKNTMGSFDEMFEPASTKLLPDWPTAPMYGNPPPGTPAPPLLVIDLEKTLIGSEYDTKHGWRHVKRPGLDKFIDRLSQYYEIVIFSENDMTEEIAMAVDKKNACHKLGAAAAEARDGVLLKRLDYMNRDLSRIILIDDSEEASSLFPRNTLRIKPFSDVHDKSDTELDQLVPLLQAMVHDGVQDFRDTIDDLGTHEVSEAAAEYQMRIAQHKQTEQRKKDQGLGSFIRSEHVRLPGTGPAPRPAAARDPLAFTQPQSKASQLDQDLDVAPSTSSLLDRVARPHTHSAQPDHTTAAATAASESKEVDLAKFGLKSAKSVGEKGVIVKKKGALFEWLDQVDKEKEDQEMRKREKMNEIHAAKMREKALQEQERLQREQAKRDLE